MRLNNTVLLHIGPVCLSYREPLQDLKLGTVRSLTIFGEMDCREKVQRLGDHRDKI